MILESARRLTSRRADGVFDLSEVVRDLRERGCPYDDFERVGRGQCRLCRSGPARPAGQ